MEGELSARLRPALSVQFVSGTSISLLVHLANLLKLLVVLICLAAILQQVLPLAGINWL